MPSRFRNITVDCADAQALAGFWAEVLGWHVFCDDDPEVSSHRRSHTSAMGRRCSFPVPETKTAKNRMHLDLQPTDGTRDEEVERLTALGATVVEDHRIDGGAGWVWMSDPEGNEFCVEHGASERAATRPQRYRVTQMS